MSEIIIRKFLRVDINEIIRVQCDYEIIGNENPKINDYGTLFFDIEKKDEIYISDEVCDAFVLGLLPIAIRNKYDIISPDKPISEDLYYAINDIILPTFCNADKRFYNTKINAQKVRYKTSGVEISTTGTFGVDSSYSIFKHYKHPTKSRRLTDIIRITWGGLSTVVNSDMKKKMRAIGLPLTRIGTNFFTVFKIDYFVDWILACVLITKKKWAVFYLPSSYHFMNRFTVENIWLNNDVHMVLLTHALCTENFLVYSDGIECTRLQKVESIVKSPISYTTLNPCDKHSVNCNWCDKCIRTLTSLDLVGYVDRYEEVFDINEYKDSRLRYLEYVYLNRDKDIFMKEIYSKFCSKEPEFMHFVEKRIESYDIKENQGWRTLKPLIELNARDGDAYSKIRSSRDYRLGNNVKKDLDQALKLLEGPTKLGIKAAKDEYILTLTALGDYNSVLTYGIEQPDNAIAMLTLGRLYRDGKGVSRDKEKALEFLEKSADMGNIVAMNEFTDLVIDMEIECKFDKIIKMCLNNADMSDSGALFRMYRIKRHGIGMPPNLKEAKKYLELSDEFKFPLAKRERINLCIFEGNLEVASVLYFELSDVQKIKTSEDLGIAFLKIGNYIRAIEFFNESVNLGNVNAAGHLGRMYRDGKGVEKDLIQAAKFMRISNEGTGWAKSELFDVLWTAGTSESYEEMKVIAESGAKSGDGPLMGRLGRMYRDGKGVKKNLSKAIDWMRKSANENMGWAKSELFDMLWIRNKPEDLEEMKVIAESGAKSGDGPLMGRLGRMYRDGKGIERDYNKALEWMQKASNKNLIWAKKELMNMRYESFLDQKKNLVIFNAGHYSAISLMIALSMSKHKGDYTILLTLPREDMPSLSSNFYKERIFDYIITYRDNVVIKSNSNFEKNITQYFEEVLGPFKDHIDNSICYVSADQIDAFGLYLLSKNKTFFVNELSSNQFTSSWRGKSLLNRGNISEEYYIYQSEAGVIDGTSDQIRPIYFKGTSKYPIRTNPDDGFTCDYMNLLDNLADEDKKSILSSFSMENHYLNGNVQLILLNRLTNIAENSSYTIFEIPYVYQTIIDYFGNKELVTVIKQHPDDTVDISNKFNEITLNRFFPIELLRLHDNISIHSIIGLYTTATERISDIVGKNIILGQIYLKICPFIHSLYSTLSIIAESDFKPEKLFVKLTDFPVNEVDFFKKFITNFNLDQGIIIEPLSSYNNDEKSILLVKDDIVECNKSSIQIVLSTESKPYHNSYVSDFEVSVFLKGKDEWFIGRNGTETNRILSNLKLNIVDHVKEVYLKSCGASLEIHVTNLNLTIGRD